MGTQSKLVSLLSRLLWEMVPILSSETVEMLV